MSISLPEYISRDQLLDRLQREVATLADSDLSWWRQHSVEPFPVRNGDLSHFVVAVSGHDVLFFADDEDEFGQAKLEAGSETLTNCGLFGDLLDAIRGIRRVVAQHGA